MASTLSSLLSQATVTDHDQVLQAADATLANSSQDSQAQHVKVVALLKLDRYHDALKTLEAGGPQLQERARLEHAYALYKCGQPAKAAEVARHSTSESERGLRHVEAQASYRHEDFERAAELYHQLSSASGAVSNEDTDLRINTGAAHAQLEWSGHATELPKPTRDDLSAFETAYNAACASIARHELGQAEVLLKRAKDLCLALDDTELSQDDKEAELVPITVQQIYVLIRQGKLDQARSLAANVNPKDLHDSSTQFIARTNTAAASSDPANPYLTHRLLHKSPESILPDKPFAYQSAAMRRNNYALDLLAQKYDGIIRSTASVVAANPSPTLDANVNSLSAFSAAAHAHNQAGKEALKAVLPVLGARPDDIGLLLVVTQLYVLSGNHGAAISLLETFFNRLARSGNSSDADVRHAPGLVATLVSLYSARGQTSHVRSELARAAKYWRQRSKDSAAAVSSRALSHLYKTAGAALLDSTNSDDQALAADIFTHLHNEDPEDRYSTAGLVAALSLSNPPAIDSSYLSSLTPVDRLVTGVDISALESSGVAKPVTSVVATSTKRSAPTETPTTTRKSKKLRKSKTPKDYDPSKKPDPERWLPMKDRSYYRPKGKKAKARQAMFMQGGVADEARESSQSRPATPAIEAKTSGQAKKNKKKGKGNKW